jgi:hypothetical protein
MKVNIVRVMILCAFLMVEAIWGVSLLAPNPISASYYSPISWKAFRVVGGASCDLDAQCGCHQYCASASGCTCKLCVDCSSSGDPGCIGNTAPAACSSSSTSASSSSSSASASSSSSVPPVVPILLAEFRRRKPPLSSMALPAGRRVAPVMMRRRRFRLALFPAAPKWFAQNRTSTDCPMAHSAWAAWVTGMIPLPSPMRTATQSRLSIRQSRFASI